MTSFIIAQIIGTAGYFLYVTSPHFNRREHVLRTEILAYLVLALQWALLGQTILLIGNLLVLFAALISLAKISQKTKTRLFNGLYILAIALILVFWRGTIIDVFAATGTFLVIASKTMTDMARFRFLSGVSGVILSISAALAFCLPAVFFNILFALGHFRNVWALNLIIDDKRASPTIVK